MIMINMTPMFPLSSPVTWAGHRHRVGRSFDDMRNFYQQCSASLDVLWADTKWTVWTEASHDDQRRV